MANYQSHFSVKSPDHNREYSVNLSPPEEIGNYSVNGNNEFVSDRSQLKYLVMPDNMDGIDWDLNDGFAAATCYGLQETRRLDHLLEWILSNREIKQQILGSRECTFIFNRGTLGTIMRSAHSPEDWLICATRFKGAIYLALFRTEKYSKKQLTRREKLQCFWGSKFEQYITSSLERGLPNTASPVNQYEQFYIVLNSQLGSHHLLYSAEIDAVDPSHSEREHLSDHYVELKTAPIRDDKSIHRNKLIQWYVQCWLTGLRYLLCGFRNNNGIVRWLEWISISEMKSLSDGFFDRKELYGLGNRFLEFVERVAVKDDHRIVYMFSFDPKDVDRRGRRRVTWQEHNRPSNYIVLPQWYTSRF